MQTVTETDRLKLVEFTDEDLDQLFLLTSNEEVMKYFPSLLSLEETEQMLQKILQRYTENGYSFWKVLLKPTDEFIGIAGLLHQEFDDKTETEIGYRLLPEHWGKGYATEAATACKQYAEEELGKERLISLIRPENVPSARVATRLGAKRTHSITYSGLEHDVYVYANQQ